MSGPPIGMTITLQASSSFRRGVLLASLGVAVVEIGLFVMLWRVGSLVDPGVDRNAALLLQRTDHRDQGAQERGLLGGRELVDRFQQKVGPSSGC